MKKLLTIIAFILCTQVAQAQTPADIKLGVNAGFPVGDSSSFTDFNWGFDAAYLFDFAGIFQGGPLIGYSSFLGDDNVDFLPFAASGRINLPMTLIGLDIGYAVGLGGGEGSGFFYRPKVGLEMRFFDIIASYSGISVSDRHLSSVNLGVEFSL